jgi:Lrp/AsnC family transcriptional regulator for asnA, asnC and gidA
MDDAAYFRSLGLDSKDLKIMFELDCNSRQSNASIGKKVRLDKGVVAYRINNLIKKGFIERFYALIDSGKLGFKGYRIYLKWQFVNEKTKNEIIAYLKKVPFTWWIGEISGEWSLGFVVWVKEFSKFERFWFEFLSKYQKNIQKKEFAIYSKLYNCNYAFLSPEKVLEHKCLATGKEGKEKITKAEEKILEIISDNARMPTVEIAKKTKLSVSGVKAALKKLQQKEIIKGFRTHFNDEKLGYSLYKINFYLNDLENYNKMAEMSIAEPKVIYVPQSIGFAEFEVEIMEKNINGLEDFIKKITGKYSDSIREYNYFAFTKVHKIKYW